MPRSALSRVGPSARTKVNQALATEPPAEGTERDGVTYGATVTIGGEPAEAKTKTKTSSSTSTETKS